MAIKWLRSEFKNEKLETAEDFASRRGITKQSLRAYFSNYADWLPKPVAIEGGRLKKFLSSELDDFLDRIQSQDRPRSRQEVAAAKVARLTEWVKTSEERAEKREQEYANAARDLKSAQSSLREALNELELLSPNRSPD